MGCFDLKAELSHVMAEINEYKWLQSEKEGFDIGISRATREWIEKYYDQWFSYNSWKFIKETADYESRDKQPQRKTR